jgi:O-antigen ligase
VLPLQTAGWLVVGGAALFAIVLEPLAAVYALPIAVAFGSLLPLDVHGFHAGPTDLLVGGLVLAYIVRERQTLRRRARAVWEHPQVLGQRPAQAWRSDRARFVVFTSLLAYLAVVVLSGAVASNRAAVVKEVLKWSEVATLAALALWLLRDARQVRVLAWMFIAAGIAESLLGYVQWVLSSGDIGSAGSGIRVFGTFAQPNPYAGYLNFALPLALALVLFAHDARERWVAAAASCLLLGAQVLAASRGGLLGLAAACIILVVVGFGRERFAALVALVGVPLAALAWLTHLIPVRIQSALLDSFRVSGATVCGQVNSRTFSTVERLAHWLAGLRMFQAHPLLGVGAGNYDTAYARYACPDWPESLGHAHNYYINAAAETGLLGLAAFLIVTGAVLYLGWRASRAWGASVSTKVAVLGAQAQTAVPARALAVGFFALLAALAVHNLTDDLFVHSMELQVALSIACLLRLLALSKQAA